MFFRKSREQVDRSVNKMDKIVTGIILGAAVASIFGLSRTRKGQEISSYVKKRSESPVRKGFGLFGKILATFVSMASKKR